LLPKEFARDGHHGTRVDATAEHASDTLYTPQARFNRIPEDVYESGSVIGI
jgi:hypothetical protein